eukprot:198669-Rhodomonas_salina.1
MSAGAGRDHWHANWTSYRDPLLKQSLSVFYLPGLTSKRASIAALLPSKAFTTLLCPFCAATNKAVAPPCHAIADRAVNVRHALPCFIMKMNVALLRRSINQRMRHCDDGNWQVVIKMGRRMVIVMGTV